MRILESGKLMKIHVTFYEGMWSFRPETDLKGNRLEKKEIRFHGGLEEGIGVLRMLDAKDADIAPAGKLRRSYPALAKDLMEGFSKHIWAGTRDWDYTARYF